VLFTKLPDASPTKTVLDQLNYQGALQVLPCHDMRQDTIRTVLDGASGLLCRPNDGLELVPSHLQAAVFPFVVGTLGVGTEHLLAVEGVPGLSIQRSSGGNARGVAELTIKSCNDPYTASIHSRTVNGAWSLRGTGGNTR